MVWLPDKWESSQVVQSRACGLLCQLEDSVISVPVPARSWPETDKITVMPRLYLLF